MVKKTPSTEPRPRAEPEPKAPQADPGDAASEGEPYPVYGIAPSVVSEAAASRHPPAGLGHVMAVVGRLMPEELELFEQMTHLGDPRTEDGRERRRRVARGLRRSLEEHRHPPADDPLADVDEPLDAEASIAAVAWADLEAREQRARLLRDCVDAASAGRLTGRSRQAVERQRRDGRLLALREGRQWRYPAWQFDQDGPGGLLPGLPEVLEHLAMTPAAAAFWLLRERPELDGDAPAERLRRRDAEPVLRLARHQGRLP